MIMHFMERIDSLVEMRKDQDNLNIKINPPKMTTLRKALIIIKDPKVEATAEVVVEAKKERIVTEIQAKKGEIVIEILETNI